MELTKEQQNQVNKIGKKYNLKFILIYGSFATNNVRPGSDFDVAVLGNKEIGFKTLLAIHGELSGVFGDNKDRELDLKSLHGANILFRYHVVRDGILIYGDITQYNKFKAYAFRSYQDGEDLFNLQDKLIRLRLKHLKQNYAR